MIGDPRDRTGVPPPRTFGLGLAGYALLSAVIPLSVCTAAVIWSPLELDMFVYGLFATMVIALALVLPVALGTRQRRWWWIRWFRAAGACLLGAYAIAWLVVLAYPIGVVPLRPGNDPGLIAAAWLAVVLMGVFGVPAAVMLVRALRHPYWRPDAPRELWTDTTTSARPERHS